MPVSKRRRALDLGGQRLLEAAVVREAGELVGDRLALDGLVQLDVLDRHAGLGGEVVEELALARREGRLAAPDQHDALDLSLAPRSGWPSALPASVGTSRGWPLATTSLSTSAMTSSSPAGRRCSRAPRAPAGLGAQRRAAAVGRHAVSRRPDEDLEQRVAVEVRRERLADAAQLVLQARALLVELDDLVLELARHRVELDAERGELVLALDRDLGGEVAAAQPLGGLQERGDPALQRPRHDRRERERQDEEPGQQRAGEQARVADRLVGLGLPGEERDARAGVAEPLVVVERRHAVLLAGDVDLADRQRQRVARDAVDRRPERLVPGADHHVQPGDPPHGVRVRLRGPVGDLEPVPRALRVHDVALGHGGRDGRPRVEDLIAAHRAPCAHARARVRRRAPAPAWPPPRSSPERSACASATSAPNRWASRPARSWSSA